jgi:hypothetical protein
MKPQIIPRKEMLKTQVAQDLENSKIIHAENERRYESINNQHSWAQDHDDTRREELLLPILERRCQARNITEENVTYLPSILEYLNNL